MAVAAVMIPEKGRGEWKFRYVYGENRYLKSLREIPCFFMKK